MKKNVLLLVIVTMLTIVFSACNVTGPSAGTGSDTPSNDSVDSTQSRDTINLSVSQAFTSTDAHGNRSVNEMIWRTQIYEALYHLNENTLEFEPRLAESYTVSDDGLIYTFNLRKGVKFHNGDEMKASDVVFSFEHIKKEGSWKSFYGNIDHAKALDDYTVEVHVLKPSAVFLLNVSQIWIESEREVTEQGDTFGTKVALAGTGPYFLTEYNSETNLKMEAFPDYWRGEAPIKYVNYKVIADSNTGLIAFETGELDWYIAPISNWDSLSKNDKFSSEMVTANHVTYAFINYDANDVLRNDKVRQAIAYAIDKEAMNLAAFDGYAVEADYLENPQFNVGAPKGDVVYNYNSEKAKELLVEAGYPDGVYAGVITTSSSGYFPQVAQVLQANLDAVGIKTDIELVEQAASIARFRTQDFDIGVLGYSSTGDYDSVRMRVCSENVGSYFVKFEGDKFDYKYFDELIAKQAAELDPAKRLAIAKELNDAVMETACYLPLLHKVQPCVWNKDLNVVNVPNFYEVYDWSWK